MGSKALVRLVIVLAVVGVLALIVKLTGPGTVKSVSGGDNAREMVFDNYPEGIDKIRIKDAEGEVNIVRGTEKWEVAERDNHPADAKAVVEFVRKVFDLKVLQTPEIGASQFARLKLIDPDKASSADSATVVSFLDSEGKELESLWLGKIYERADGRPSPFGGSGTTEAGRYVKPGGEEVVFLVGEPFSDIEAAASEWISEDFFAIEKVKSISLESKPREAEGDDDKDAWTAEDNWALTRDEITGDFTLVDPKEGEELDPTKVSAMKTAFSSPRFEDVAVNDEAKDNQPDQTTFKVETFDGFTYTIKVSGKNDLNELYLTYNVDADFEEKRKPGEEETDEEKAQKDKAFADKLENLRKKLAAEKAIEGRIYKVRSFVIDPINKKRSELLKEEEGDDDTAGGAPTVPGGLPGGLPPNLPPGLVPPPPADPPNAPEPPKPDETPEPPTKPDMPAEPKPDAPADEPDAPADKPDAPADKPDAPAGKPDAPADKPDAPADKPDAPADKPDAPADKPDAPADKPDAPADKPDAPADKPDASADKPDTPPADPAGTEGGES